MTKAAIAKAKRSASPSKSPIRQTSSTKTRTTRASALKLLSPNRHFGGSTSKQLVAMEHEIVRLTTTTEGNKEGASEADKRNDGNNDDSTKITQRNTPTTAPSYKESPPQQPLRRKLSHNSSPISKRLSQTAKRHSSTSKSRSSKGQHHSQQRVERAHWVEWKANTQYCLRDKGCNDLAVSSTPLMTSQTFQSCSTTSSFSSPNSGTFPFDFGSIPITNLKEEQQKQQPQQQALPNDVVEYFDTNKQAWGYLRSLTEGVKSYGLDHFGRSSSEINVNLQQDEQYPYTPSGFLIGSDPSCDIRIPNLESRHSFIYMRWYSEDNIYSPQLLILDRSNKGLLLDGRQIPKSQETNILRHGCLPGENTPVTYIQNGQMIQLNGETDDGNVLFQLYISTQKIQRCARRMTAIEDLYDYDPYDDNIGKGNYGSVYRAKCKSTKKLVAVKKMELNEQPYSVIQSLCREVAINVLLKPHPCIIRFENVMEECRTVTIADQIYKKCRNVYLIMEHGRDGDLFDLVNKAHPIPEDDVIVIFDQLFHAISHLHGQGIAHRDLKLENVVVLDSKRYRVKLCDFGLATFERYEHSLMTNCGTLEYSAPELLSNGGEQTRGYTKAVDIWSLGIMLYNTLTKRSAYPESCSVKQTMYEYVCSGKFPDIGGPRWERISDQGKDLLLHMLAPNPKQRYNIDQLLAHPWAQRAQVLPNRSAPLVKYLKASS